MYVVIKMERAFCPIILFANDIFFDDEEEENDEYGIPIKYFLEEIQYMETRQFKRHFRLDSNTFEDLISKLYTVYSASKIGHPEISLQESCLICLWYLANIESFRGVASRFKVSKSTAWSAVLRICKAIILLNERYHLIAWPSPQRCQMISNSFLQKHNIPGIIGTIDGSHIRILPPKNYPNSYINRKSYHSVILQGICDHRKLFIDVYAGEAGSVHDYSVFLKSEVSQLPLEAFPNDTHLIVDLAYKLTTRLLVGFKNNGHLNQQQINFNTKLSKARVIIENTFALLKGRFRRLKFIESKIPEIICHIILTSCILHNICILKGDDADDIIDVQEELRRERLNNPYNRLDIPRMDIIHDNEAIRKRNEIMNALWIN